MEALREKVKANRDFKRFDFAAAIRRYSRCIELDPSYVSYLLFGLTTTMSVCRNEIYYSNRSAAYQSLDAYEESMRDAKKVVELNPGWMKGWGRLAMTQSKLGLHRLAKKSYEKALELQPNYRLFLKGLEQVLTSSLDEPSTDLGVFPGRGRAARGK